MSVDWGECFQEDVAIRSLSINVSMYQFVMKDQSSESNLQPKVVCIDGHHEDSTTLDNPWRQTRPLYFLQRWFLLLQPERFHHLIHLCCLRQSLRRRLISSWISLSHIDAHNLTGNDATLTFLRHLAPG